MFKINKISFELNKNEKGFTFVELLVSFAIVTTSMVFIFGLIVQNIQVQKINKDFLTASMLAQEGLELVRNSRDENWLLESTPGVAVNVWDGIIGQNINDFCLSYDGDNVPIDVDGITAAGARLYVDATGFYTHDSTAPNIPTQFYRIIQITPGSGSNPDYDYVSVVSDVEWKVRGKTHKYIAEALLYDWR